jgi:hypothetical protein
MYAGRDPPQLHCVEMVWSCVTRCSYIGPCSGKLSSGSEWRDHFWFCNCTCTLSVPIINDYLLCIIFTRYSRVNSGHYWDLISHQHVKSQGSTEKLTDSNVGRKFVPQMKKKRDFSACFSASLLYAILLFNQESQSHKIRSHIPIKSDRTYTPM